MVIPSKNASELEKFYFQLNKNSEKLNVKSFGEAVPDLWNQTTAVSVHIIANDMLLSSVRGNIDSFSTVKNAVVSGGLPILIMGPDRFGNDAVFQEKISGFIQSYRWQIKDYFVELLKQNMKLPEGMKVSFITGEEETFPDIKTSDKDIIVFLNFYMIGDQSGWGEPHAPLTGMTGVTLSSGNTLQEFIQKYNGLPLAQTVFLPANKAQLYAGLWRVKIYPDMYMGSITGNSKSYSKSEWMSEDGAFLEKQLKSILEALAIETAALLKKN